MLHNGMITSSTSRVSVHYERRRRGLILAKKLRNLAIWFHKAEQKAPEFNSQRDTLAQAFIQAHLRSDLPCHTVDGDKRKQVCLASKGKEVMVY